mmetsp:Transcript_25045/g.70597  ORF Transcript_25045/g.70597 Transcript_25045/m.70597 type:complete len:218 (+) Transcript_25045:1387-2040(+)
MLLHPLLADLGPQLLHQAVLVHRGALPLERALVPDVVEQVLGHPLLEQEPISEIDAPHKRPHGFVAACEEHLPQRPARGLLVVGLHLVESRRLVRLHVQPRLGDPQRCGLHVPPRDPGVRELPGRGRRAAQHAGRDVHREVSRLPLGALAQQRHRRQAEYRPVHHEGRRRVLVHGGHDGGHEGRVGHGFELGGVVLVAVADDAVPPVSAVLPLPVAP